MTEKEWLECEATWPMWRHLSGIVEHIHDSIVIDADKVIATERQCRMYACACCLRIGRPIEDVEKWEKTGYRFSRGGIYPSHEWASQWINQTYDKLPEKVAVGFLRDIFGNPFRPVELPWTSPPTGYGEMSQPYCSWLTYDVRSIANRIYEERRFADMAIALPDALEEAGCTQPQIMEHCRGTPTPGCDKNWCLGTDHRWPQCPACGSVWDEQRGCRVIHPTHVRGCWVLELLRETNYGRHHPGRRSMAQ